MDQSDSLINRLSLGLSALSHLFYRSAQLLHRGRASLHRLRLLLRAKCNLAGGFGYLLRRLANFLGRGRERVEEPATLSAAWKR